MAIGTARGARGTMTPNNFQNRIPIWPPRLREIIKMVITPSVFVIRDIHFDSMTIGVSRGDRGTRPPINFPQKKSNMAVATS